MANDSKRCPIESSLFCDIVDECNPFVVSGDVYAISPRCPHLKRKKEDAKGGSK